MTAFTKRFFLTAHPLRSLAEMWAIGLALLWMLAALLASIRPYVTTSGLLLVLGACGMWCVLRTRLPAGHWLSQALWESAVATGVAAVMVVGVLGVTQMWPWGRERIVGLSDVNGGSLMLAVLFAATGVGYFITRVGLRLLIYWNHLRRRRLLWSITHVHLLLVVLLVLAAALVLTLTAPFSTVSPTVSQQPANWLVAYLARLFLTVAPTLGVFVILGTFALLVVLPPSALLSYFIARGTTRRLEHLTRAAAALRGGDYTARCAVEGEDEVAQLQSDFNAMAEELERSLRALQAERDRVAGLLEARRALTANISHELRTPVATVRAALESTIDRWNEAPSDRMRGDLEVMQGEMLRLQGLIDDLFTLARADAGGLPIERTPVNLRDVAERMAGALAPLAWRTGRVELVADIPADLPRVSADEGRLEQVLANLLRNAIRHTPPGGIVVLRAAAVESGVQIQVCDTGEGIAVEDLPHIWERFYRGAEGRQRDAGGAGLGLALVKELTEAMGGTVAVERARGEGTCFNVTLAC